MNPHLSLLVFSLLPSVVLARGGRGGGRGGGGGGDLISNSMSSLSFQEPIFAAIFAFCVIFAVLTALQAAKAVDNIRRRIIQQPSSIILPEFSVGPIFPTFLFLSTLCLTPAYAMHAAYYGLEYNENNRDPPSLNDSFFIAWNILGFLADVFLVSGILALITHRQKVLFNVSKTFCDAKVVVDAVLIVILLALSMGNVGLTSVASTDADVETGRRLYVAYISFLFVAIVDIAASSIFLYVLSMRAPIDDHKVALCLTFIISPLFFIYALFPIVLQGIRNSTVVIEAARGQLDLSGVVISCITEFIIIATCLKFGMPFIPKQKGAEEHSHKHKGSYA